MPDITEITNKIHSERGTLFILCGYPYAGKSLVARELLATTGIAYVSIDDIFHAEGFNWGSDRLPDKKAWERIFEESYARTKGFLKSGRNVLYDSTNHTIESRDRLREIARSVEAAAYVIYVQASTESVWRRWEANTEAGDRHVVSRDLVAATIRAFEPPGNEENVLRIKN